MEAVVAHLARKITGMTGGRVELKTLVEGGLEEILKTPEITRGGATRERRREQMQPSKVAS